MPDDDLQNASSHSLVQLMPGEFAAATGRWELLVREPLVAEFLDRLRQECVETRWIAGHRLLTGKIDEGDARRFCTRTCGHRGVRIVRRDANLPLVAIHCDRRGPCGARVGREYLGNEPPATLRRTFWFTLLWILLGGFTAQLLLGFVILGVAAIGFVYRIARGRLWLADAQAMYS